ncbi:TlpA disulfide reductase family protein [uncultured Chitinophaga sp.]|uniref:TlpA family protein disulfide reductase n=1 Tax=uncultured Chitinophaga sp. TaxID=339340 RepID=UPI0025F10B2E|nr:TlpA disulfide reductase family protein [uncultured Chitinophaga sp.]
MRKWLSVVAALLAAGGSVSGQDSSRLKGLETPVAGSTLQLRYNPAGGPLEGKQEVNGLIYLFSNYRWKTDDLVFKQQNGQWTGTYTLPENCAFVAVKLVDEAGVADNNNDRGYVVTTVGKNGGRVPGSALAWGTFRKPSFNKAPGGYFNKFEIGDEALEMWVRKEMEYFPDSMPRFFDSYIAMLKISLGDEFAEKAPRNLERFGKFHGLTEMNYNTIHDTYRFQLKNTVKADSIRKVMLARFPNGRTARFQRFNELNAMPMDEKKLAALEQFLKDFPVAEFRRDTPVTQHFVYYNTYRTVAAAYVAKGMKDKLVQLLPELDFRTLTEVYHHNFEGSFITGKGPVEKLIPFSVLVIDEMVKKQHDLSFMENDRYTPLKAEALAQEQLDSKLGVHVGMLVKKKSYKEAAGYLSQISAKNKYKNASLNEARITILENTGGKKQLTAEMEASVHANAATPLIIEKLKKAYKGKPETFDAYLESLKPAADVATIKADIKSKLINAPITQFRLQDLNGNTINSADWKDKIVVIDYWATWCFPCKMAFPGMQLAVNKYKNDASVAFYFIATMERSDNYKADIKKYIGSSGFTFNVLYDDENPETKGLDRVFKSMVPVFHSSAIPRKVVVKNGMIRYTSEGYLGSPSGLADELSYVIEILKAEQS